MRRLGHRQQRALIEFLQEETAAHLIRRKNSVRAHPEYRRIMESLAERALVVRKFPGRRVNRWRLTEEGREMARALAVREALVSKTY